ncbi:hypothetical protein SAMD00019534_095550 [Acytostelium subglobosum LB1]|uniref:hypothetical protein n=1 Tax=Acytostelium subglobosum LB1 TaxID=1410327 RepID=UPI000644D9A1|nr:hypothetical protein SAMD00019534_095550 [Acytostelium subglobosum LB1]GAM26380.1 hypothetical protein SAMD00019534_095550 [Acytostelium subglobosum LB1]|eukprot:XP_012750476.1 hypothetical protein SAMD00019534_095550 [Acytostelium subglobosum LB1]
MSVTSVYRYIIDDVIRNIRAEFANEGLEDTVILELQHTPSTETTSDQPSSTTTTTTSSSSSKDNSSKTSTTTSNTSPTTSSPPAINNNNRQSNDLAHDHVRSTLNTLRQFNATPPTTTIGAPGVSGFGKPQQFMPNRDHPPHGLELPKPGSSHSLMHLMNLPQNDGSSDEVALSCVDNGMTKEHIDSLIAQRVKEQQSYDCSFSIKIPQMDGNDDDDLDDELLEEHIPEANAGQQQDSLNSDLDDDEDNDPDPIIEHFVLCQYEKVSRIKNKRKCTFKDGIMHLNGRDALFHKANGEFVW